jgi:hypothetical protein
MTQAINLGTLDNTTIAVELIQAIAVPVPDINKGTVKKWFNKECFSLIVEISINSPTYSKSD